MVLDSSELERLSEEILTDRNLDHSVYCGNCGYNLRGLPYLGRCPECGGQYNARPLKMEGIFTPRDQEFPVSDIVVFAMGTLMAGVLIRQGINPYESGNVFMGSVAGLFALVYAASACRKLKRFIKFYGLARRIARGEDD